MKFERNYVSRHFPKIDEVSVLGIFPHKLLQGIYSGDIEKIVAVSSKGVFHVLTRYGYKRDI